MERHPQMNYHLIFVKMLGVMLDFIRNSISFGIKIHREFVFIWYSDDLNTKPQPPQIFIIPLSEFTLTDLKWYLYKP